VPSVIEAIPRLRLLSCSEETLELPEHDAAAAGEAGMETARLDLGSVASVPVATKEAAAAAELCNQLVSLLAASFDRMGGHADVAGLDAASFVRLLEDETRLQVKDETAVFQAALKWCAQPGRLARVTERVLPLVRFPLVNVYRLLFAPTDEQKASSEQLKGLMRSSATVKELVQEALDLQMRKRSTATPLKRHAVHCHTEPVAVKRHQPRAGCRDTIREFNLADAALMP